MALRDNQEALIAPGAAANPRTIVFVQAGSPITIPWVNDVAAIVEGCYPGGEDGKTTAALLFGDAYPWGKLPITFPVAMSDGLSNTPERHPGVEGKEYYDEELQVGYRCFQSQNMTPPFASGFGLFYTSFDMSELELARALILPGNAVSLQVRVSNSGDQPGAEVVQAYVAYPEQLGEPPKQLRAFQKVMLEAGASTILELVLNPRSLADWDTVTHNRVVHAGGYKVYAGNSSVDSPL